MQTPQPVKCCCAICMTIYGNDISRSWDHGLETTRMLVDRLGWFVLFAFSPLALARIYCTLSALSLAVFPRVQLALQLTSMTPDLNPDKLFDKTPDKIILQLNKKVFGSLSPYMTQNNNIAIFASTKYLKYLKKCIFGVMSESFAHWLPSESCLLLPLQKK